MSHERNEQTFVEWVGGKLCLLLPAMCQRAEWGDGHINVPLLKTHTPLAVGREGGSIRLHETQRSHFYFLTICCWSSRAKDTQTETKIELCLKRNNRSQIKCAACQVSLFSTEWWKFMFWECMRCRSKKVSLSRAWQQKDFVPGNKWTQVNPESFGS